MFPWLLKPRPSVRHTGFTLLLTLMMSPANALSVDDARHLLNRTGFGAAPHELRSLQSLTREQAVERVLGSLDASPRLAPPPAFVAQPLDGYAQRLGADFLPPSMAQAAAIDSVEDERLTKLGMQEMEQLRVWWLDRMISTPAPLAERLALLWHGHFTSKYFDVLGPRLMYDQLVTIQTQGTRSFATLMHAMLRDPAMLIFLDNAFNTRAKPNENLARELLELFTMGVGNYSEADVKALARKMAGHTVDFEGDWRYVEHSDEIDLEPVPFLGRQVRTLDEAEQVILAHPQTARFIATKFYREFVSNRPDDTEITRLATVLRTHRYELRPLLRALLLSKAFWANENRGALVKSPVELIVGVVRTFGLPLPEAGRLAQDARLLGQDLFEPPTVKGWNQGMGWLNMATLKQRRDSLTALWQCRQSGAEALHAEPGDLLVRFSVERRGDAPVGLRVLVDGKEVASGVAACASDLTSQVAGEGVSKPAWELIRVPHSLLTERPRTVDIVYQHPPSVQAHMFVNWVQLNGKRLPATLADQIYDTGESCSGQEPNGMLYCNARMHFDLAMIERQEGGMDPTLYDRRYGRFGSVIETGTSRQPLLLQPAAAPSVDPNRYTAIWRDLPLLQALLPVAPMTRQTIATASVPDAIEALMLDPAYNLK